MTTLGEHINALGEETVKVKFRLIFYNLHSISTRIAVSCIAQLIYSFEGGNCVINTVIEALNSNIISPKLIDFNVDLDSYKIDNESALNDRV